MARGSYYKAIVLIALMLFGFGDKVFAETRASKVAGQFYPESRVELLGAINALLKRQPEPIITRKPRILIVPHAGYQYSGPVAASGFRHLQSHAYKGVVVVGFMHRNQFEGSSVDTRGSYKTPLGEIPVDQEAVALLRTYPGISHIEEAHETNEHSLEVELPFLQVVLGDFKLVPILMGSADLEDATLLAEALSGLANKGDYLFVFSSDLSHYHQYDEAEAIDDKTINSIMYETPKALYRLFSRGDIEACGRGPILTSLILANKLGYLNRELLYRANSGDITGDTSAVVGYASIGMFERLASREGRLSEEAGAALVRAARDTLEHTLAKREILDSVLLERYPELSRAQGLFVTLRKYGQLRGCIGRITSEEPLKTSIGPVALDAALHDPRFSPVSAGELQETKLEVSVLTAPVKIDDPNKIVAGRDGVIIDLDGHLGIFLPQVWEETGWSRVEFLSELASQKAGLPPDAWQRASLYVFQDQIFEE